MKLMNIITIQDLFHVHEPTMTSNMPDTTNTQYSAAKMLRTFCVMYPSPFLRCIDQYRVCVREEMGVCLKKRHIVQIVGWITIRDAAKVFVPISSFKQLNVCDKTF